MTKGLKKNILKTFYNEFNQAIMPDAMYYQLQFIVPFGAVDSQCINCKLKNYTIYN